MFNIHIIITLRIPASNRSVETPNAASSRPVEKPKSALVNCSAYTICSRNVF